MPLQSPMEHPIDSLSAAPWPAPPIRLQGQLLANWCWAACIAMAAYNKSPSLQQCEVASGALNLSCCRDRVDPENLPCEGIPEHRLIGLAHATCNRPIDNEQIQALLKQHAGSAAEYTARTLTKKELVRELSATPRRPVVMGIKLGRWTNHAVVVVDHREGNFRLYDPCFGGEISLTYDGVVGHGKGIGGGCWTYTGAPIMEN